MSKPPSFDPIVPMAPDPNARGKSMMLAWLSLVLAAASIAGEVAVIATWEHGNCNIELALLCFAGAFCFTGLTPIITLVQQLRSQRGTSHVGQAVTLYVLSFVMAGVVLVAMLPLIFADAC